MQLVTCLLELDSWLPICVMIMPKAFLTVVDTIYVLWRPGGGGGGEIDGFNKNWAHERLTMLHTFSRAASAFTLVDQYRAKHRLCTSAIPDPSLDAGHAKRGRPSVEKDLRCHVGVWGNRAKAIPPGSATPARYVQ